MKELKVTLTFVARADGAVLVETNSYFIPFVGDTCVIKGADKVTRTYRVFSREFRFEENRVILIVYKVEATWPQ